MKAIDLLSAILRHGINNTQCTIVTFCDDEMSIDDEVYFYFCGRIRSGRIERGRTYVAFFGEESLPDHYEDAIIVTDLGDIIYLVIID